MVLKALPKSKKIELLRDFRTKSLRNPTTVALLAADVLASGTTGLGDEQFTIIEQYLIASLELGSKEQAGKCLAQLTKNFGTSSVRVRKLQGLYHESVGKVAEAREVYKSILKDTPGDAFVVKRFSTMLKAEGNYSEAIDMLESVPIYLDEDKQTQRFLAVHNTDEAAYRELINLNYMLRRWERCLFYAEEVILLSPYSYLSHVRHAELCFIAKEYERCASAYAHSLTINDSPNNSRAAYGLWAVANELLKLRSNNRNNGGESVEEVKALKQWAIQRLKWMYQGSPMAAMLEVTLQNDQ